MHFIDETNEIDTFIRGVKNEAGQEVWSVYDFINVADAEKINSDFGREIFDDLIKKNSDNYSAIMPLCTYNKFASMFYLFILNMHYLKAYLYFACR